RPKFSPASSGGVMRARKARDEDWTGPTKRHMNTAQPQKTAGSSDTAMGTEEAMRQRSPVMMTAGEPNRSSSHPAVIAPIPADTFATTPRRTTSEALSPYEPAASTPAKAKIAA